MRVSTRLLYGGLTDNINTQASRLQEAQQQAATGQRLQRPSDDPAGAGRATFIQSQLSDLAQYRSNANSVNAMLSTADGALSTLSDALRSARSLALSGATSAVGEDQRAILASQVDQLISQSRQAAETTYAGRYLFSGTNTRTSPLQSSGNAQSPYTYAGNDGQRLVEISEGVMLSANASGREVFNFDGVGDPDAPDMFTALATVRDQLQQGNTPGLSQSLDTMDRLISNMTKVRAEVGQSIQRLELNTTHIEEQTDALNELKSDITGADLAETLVNYKTSETTYQATIALASRIDQPSLFEFLR